MQEIYFVFLYNKWHILSTLSGLIQSNEHIQFAPYDLKESKRNDKSNYKDQFNKKVTEGLCKNDNRCKSIEFEDIEKIKLKTIKDFYNNRFANSSDFVFTFVGDFEIEKIKPYIQKYLGNLPSIDRKESYIDNNIIFNGSGTFELKKNTEKNAVARYIFSSPYINLPKNRATIYLANIILNRILKEEIRGSRELVYSIGSARNLINLPKYHHLNYIYFNSDPKNIQKIYFRILFQYSFRKYFPEKLSDKPSKKTFQTKLCPGAKHYFCCGEFRQRPYLPRYAINR